MLSRGFLRTASVVRPRINRSLICGLRFASDEAMVDKIIKPETAYTKKNDDRLIGDYPDVKPEYFHHRNPYLKYDEQQNKRNTGEPIYQYYDMVDVWSPDRFDEVSDSVALRNTAITITAFAAFSMFIYYCTSHESPAVRRQYPHEGIYKALGGTEETKSVFQVSFLSGYLYEYVTNFFFRLV